MDEKLIEQNETVDLDLKRLVNAVIQKAWLLILVAVISASAALVGTVMLIKPQYQSSAMFYVNNGSLSIGNTSLSLSASDISASRGLVQTYIAILSTRETLNDVIDYSGVDISYGQLKGMVSAEAVGKTEIFTVSVTHPNPETAKTLADAIAHILPKRINTIIENSSAQVVDSAVVPSSPVSPNYTKNTLLGFVIGLALTMAIVVVRELLDVTIRAEEDIGTITKHPVLCSVPDMANPNKGGHYYRYGYGYGYGNRRKSLSGNSTEPVMVGADISFAASEAYKLLRTKLQYSFAGERNCRVIGVSSALTGEGKSLTSVNLAYTLSQLDKKVLLIDCDMRRPSICTKLSLPKSPGLSGYLSGQNDLTEIVRDCNIKNEENAFRVISSGQNPPNPIELLSSEKMAGLLEKLRASYDYVILDLPPVEEVSDALAVAKQTDGMLLVVRQHYCDRHSLSGTVRQFDFMDCRVLGVVYNCTVEEGRKYGGGYYYRRYYRRHYGKYARKYEGSYAASQPDAQKKAQ